jgi:hypothetical protein
LEVQEAMMAEEQARGMHMRFVGRVRGDSCMRGQDQGEHTTEAGHLSQLVVGISNALADIGMLPIQDISQLPKSAQEVLTVAGLLLERL